MKGNIVYKKLNKLHIIGIVLLVFIMIPSSQAQQYPVQKFPVIPELSCFEITDISVCVDQFAPSGNASKAGAPPYLYNDSDFIYLNDTHLNLTIDDRSGGGGSVDDVWVNETGDTMTGDLNTSNNDIYTTNVYFHNSGNAFFQNNRSIWFEDSGGTPRQLFKLGSSDIMTFGSTAISDIRFAAGSVANAINVKNFTGFVGINDTNPSYLLDVDGNAHVSRDLLADGTLNFSSSVFMGIVGSALTMKGNEVEFISTSLSPNIEFTAAGSVMKLDNSGAVFNDGAIGAKDFRVETTDFDHMMFIDALNNKAGINTSTPSTAFEVNGDFNVTGEVAPQCGLIASFSQDLSGSSDQWLDCGQARCTASGGIMMTRDGYITDISGQAIINTASSGDVTMRLRINNSNVADMDFPFLAADGTGIKHRSRHVPRGNTTFSQGDRFGVNMDETGTMGWDETHMQVWGCFNE